MGELPWNRAGGAPWPSAARTVATVVVALLVGGVVGWAVRGSGGNPAGPGAGGAPAARSSEPGGSRAAPDATEVADAIGPLVPPSSCPLPLDDPDLLPNAPRDYRGGVHEGVDFICGELGHVATTPLAGRVMVANRGYQEPAPDERTQLLDQAKALGDTPRWTLELLYGRVVVIDHGVIDGAGHVVTVYAHLDEIEPTLRPGLEVPAGAPVGLVGNSGTQAAGTGADEPGSYHLHWEVRVDDRFLGDGDPIEDVVAAYRRLFDR